MWGSSPRVGGRGDTLGRIRVRIEVLTGPLGAEAYCASEVAADVVCDVVEPGTWWIGLVIKKHVLVLGSGGLTREEMQLTWANFEYNNRKSKVSVVVTWTVIFSLLNLRCKSTSAAPVLP